MIVLTDKEHEDIIKSISEANNIIKELANEKNILIEKINEYNEKFKEIIEFCNEYAITPNILREKVKQLISREHDLEMNLKAANDEIEHIRELLKLYKQ
jgi:uncharacterized protein YhaN